MSSPSRVRAVPEGILETCRYCGALLAETYPETGGVDLYPQAAMTWIPPLDEGDAWIPLPGTARCERRRCRIRRWLRR